MRTKRIRKLYFIIFLVSGVGVSAALSLYALRQNINLYLTPDEVFKTHLTKGQIFRVGGLVVKGSLKRNDENLSVSFLITDFHKNIRVIYHGILPSLFKEGRGVVTEGTLSPQQVFIATEVLAKHDANYQPPAIPLKRELDGS